MKKALLLATVALAMLAPAALAGGGRPSTGNETNPYRYHDPRSNPMFGPQRAAELQRQMRQQATPRTRTRHHHHYYPVPVPYYYPYSGFYYGYYPFHPWIYYGYGY